MKLPARLGSAVVLAGLLASFLITPGFGQTPSPSDTGSPTAPPTPTSAESAEECPTESPSPSETASPTPTASAIATASPTASPTATGAPTTSPTASPTPTPSAEPRECPVEIKPGRTTDTEYLKVRVNRFGSPLEAWLKDWIRVRGGGDRRIVDPGVFASLRGLSGTGTPSTGERGVTLDASVGSDGFEDLYYEGRLKKAGDAFVTPDGLRQLPVSVGIRYFTGPEGGETEVPPEVIEAGARPQRFKIAITVTNNTRRMEEIPYTDLQTTKQMIGVAPVYTPFVARVVDVRFPDRDFDQVRADGQVSRTRDGTLVNWTMELVPPDFPAEQTAVVTGVIAKGARLPKIDVVAQPVFPPMEAGALTSEGVQFERGRRNFFYDVFGLFRENLVALTGLFGLLHDAFGNLSLPVLGPDKGNREAGSFDEPNQLWALWTLTKGMEQLDRALNGIQNGVEIARDGVKGSLATLVAMRLFLGFSTDRAATNPANLEELEGPNDVLFNSIWSDVKQILQLCGETSSFVTGPTPEAYFPRTPAMSVPLCPQTAVSFNLLLLKLGIMEHDLHSIQKENHVLDTALLAGLSGLPYAAEGNNPICDATKGTDTPAGAQCDSYNKYNFIKFPFGLEEIERGLYTIKTRGFDPLQAALGNKDTPNSLIWALHVLTDGAESQIDAFHQLGSTWRYVADSIQNFAIFGVETSRSILQWDVNAIDIDTGVRAAAVRRARETATFMGRPTDRDGQPANGQLVISFSTGPVAEATRVLETGSGRAWTALSALALLGVLLGFARFRWFLI